VVRLHNGPPKHPARRSHTQMWVRLPPPPPDLGPFTWRSSQTGKGTRIRHGLVKATPALLLGCFEILGRYRGSVPHLPFRWPSPLGPRRS